MTQAEYGLALSFFMIVGIFSVYQRVGPLHRERLRVSRYKLFAVRDELVLLVAEKKISEDDDVFRFLYDTINRLIPHTKPLTLWDLVEGLNATQLARARDDDELRRRIKKSVDHSDMAVRKVARKFFAVLAEILLDSSILIKASAATTYLGLKVFHSFAANCRTVLASLCKTQLDAYEYHKYARTFAKAH